MRDPGSSPDNPTPRSNSPYEVVRVGDDAIESTVLPLWHKGMSDPEIVNRVDQRFSWLYRDNPAGRPCTWVVKDRATQAVLGACSVVPQVLFVQDRPVRAGLMVDFIVDPKARIAGPAIALQRGLAEQSGAAGFDMLLGYPNHKAWPILARAGYKAIDITRAWARSLRRDPVGAQRVLQSKLSRRLPESVAKTAATLLAQPVAGLAQGALWGAEAVQRLLHPGLSVSLREFDGDFPQLDPSAPSRLHTDATAAHRRWRYALHPTHVYRLCELKQRGRTIAWAILRLYEESAEVQDAGWQAGRSDLPGALWWSLPGALRREGFRVLSVNNAGDPAVDRSLAAALFVQRSDRRRVILRPSNPEDAGSVSSLADGRGWHMFAGTLDI